MYTELSEEELKNTILEYESGLLLNKHNTAILDRIKSIRNVNKAYIENKNHNINNLTEEKKNLAPLSRDEIESIAKACLESAYLNLSSKYDLVANIVHDSPASQGMGMAIGLGEEPVAKTKVLNVIEQGCYRCHTYNKSTGQWFEIQDLHVSETMPQLIGLSESYILIYEKKQLTQSNIGKANGGTSGMDVP